MHKAGFVNIIGLPNVGKSTLLNALIQQRLSITSPKAQTTRHRILGMVNADDYQIVFSDTPGYINQPAYKLQKSMNEFVHEAFEDADVLMMVTDKQQKTEDQQHLIDLVNNSKTPCILVLNKIDLCQGKETDELAIKWKELIPRCEVVPLSASSGINVKKVLKKIVELLPESPAFYDKEHLTDRTLRFIVSEIVREKIFLNYKNEIPYSTQVEVETFSEEETIDRIRCNIFVERESQKAIIIGANGSALKKTGTEARLAIEDFTGKKVYLELFVKIADKWRNSDLALKKFGYRS